MTKTASFKAWGVQHSETVDTVPRGCDKPSMKEQASGSERGALLREVNDRIREIAGREENDSLWEFVCECGKTGCPTVMLTLAEYDEARRGRGIFVAAHAPEAEAKEIAETVLREHGDDPQLAVFVGSLEGRYLHVSDYACQLLRYDREELLRFKPGQLTERSEAEFAAGVARFRREGKATGRAPVRRKDGTVIELEYRAFRTSVGGEDGFVSLAKLPEPAR
jgi:PAS domain S-box-containing protein